LLSDASLRAGTPPSFGAGFVSGEAPRAVTPVVHNVRLGNAGTHARVVSLSALVHDNEPRSRWLQMLMALERPSARLAVALTVALMVLGTLWIDLATGPGREPAALYFLLVCLVAAAFGTRGALGCAVLCTLTYQLILWRHVVPYSVADVSQTVILFALGLVVAQAMAEFRQLREIHAQLRELNTRLQRQVRQAVAAEGEATERLRHGERLSALGEATAHIVHEVKNPLVTIGGFARSMREQVEPGHPVAPKLTIIAEEVTKLETLLHDLLHFSRPADTNCTAVRVEVLFEEVLVLVRSPAEQAGVTLRVDCPASLPPLAGGRSGEALARPAQPRPQQRAGHAGGRRTQPPRRS